MRKSIFRTAGMVAVVCMLFLELIVTLREARGREIAGVATGIVPANIAAIIWESQTVDQYGDKGADNSLAIDASGYPHISYREYDWWAMTDYLKYAYWNGTKWDIQYVDWTGDVGFNSSLALDGAGRPCISYHDNQARLKYARWDGSVWNITTISYAGGSPSLVLDSSDIPHISYFRPYYVKIDNLTVLQADLMYAHWDGQQWQVQTVERGGRVGEYNSLALDHQGRPHIAYRDFGTASGKLKYATWDGSLWQIQTVDDQGDAGKNPSLALDSADRPCISYMGGDYSLKYATLVGNAWQFQIVDERPGMYFLPNSLALDSEDRPCISYCDQFHVPMSLKYAAWDGSMWQIQTVDSVGSPGMSNSLALDRNNPHISYYEAIDGTGGGALKYVKFESVVTVPGVPLNVFATAGNTQATVSFTAPASDGGSAITSYTATAYPGMITAIGLASPITVTGLINGISYTFTVTATNELGPSSASSTSNSVIPQAPLVLTLDFSGTGSGTVTGTATGSPGTLSFNTSGSIPFTPGSVVNLHAEATEYSLFSNWLGACDGTNPDCVLTMDNDRNLTVIFAKDIEHMAWIDGTVNYFAAIQLAYDDALSHAIIKAWGTDFVENLTCNGSKDLILKGGYDMLYASNYGYTTLKGNLVIQSGSLTIERLVIQ